MKHDLIADLFCTLKNSEVIGKKECLVPNSKLIRNMLTEMKANKYIGESSRVDSSPSSKLKVELIGRINDCNVIKPNFSIKISDIIKFEKRYLPAHDVGTLIITTSAGVMDQREAEKKGTGGRLLGFVY